MVEVDSRARLGGVTANKKEYAQVISDCRAIYCEQRTALILDFVKLRISVSLTAMRRQRKSLSILQFRFSIDFH